VRKRKGKRMNCSFSIPSLLFTDWVLFGRREKRKGSASGGCEESVETRTLILKKGKRK
jgi:hypothetical protein